MARNYYHRSTAIESRTRFAIAITFEAATFGHVAVRESRAGQFSLSRVTQNASTSYGIAPIELQIAERTRARATERQFLTTETMGDGYCMLIFSRDFESPFLRRAREARAAIKFNKPVPTGAHRQYPPPPPPSSVTALFTADAYGTT